MAFDLGTQWPMEDRPPVPKRVRDLRPIWLPYDERLGILTLLYIISPSNISQMYLGNSLTLAINSYYVCCFIQVLMVCGPSGAGKTTVMNMLLESFPSKVSRVPALTTKIPYKSEAYGLPYVNLTASELASEVANGDAFGQCRFVKS